MANYYTDRAIVVWREFANSTENPQCPEGGNYYQLLAKQADATHALRGEEGLIACCTECERCDCWCNSAYIWGEGNEHRDASFSTIDPETFRNFTVNINGVQQCTDVGLDPWEKECWDELADHWNDIGINSTSYSLEFIDKGTHRCHWQYQYGWPNEDEDFGFTICAPYCMGGSVTVIVDVYVYHSGLGDIPAGAFEITAEISLGGGACTISCFSEWVIPYCSANTTGPISSTIECPEHPFLTWHHVEGGRATASWTTNSLVTPDHYTAKFTGDDFKACANVEPHHALVCPWDVLVTAAIEELKDPSGIIIYNTTGGARCVWSSPHLPVHDIEATFATGFIVLDAQPIDGDTISFAGYVFEFDADEHVDDESTKVTIGSNKEDTMVQLIRAIRAQSLDIAVIASDPPDNICTLMWRTSGAVGNKEITTIGDDISVTGLDGGMDRQVFLGWYWHIGLVITEDGEDAEKSIWRVWASVIYLGHPHNEGDVDGIPGLMYNCKADRDEHYIFIGKGTTNDHLCNNPPPINNGFDCKNEHICRVMSDEHEDCKPCAQGGSVNLTAG